MRRLASMAVLALALSGFLAGLQLAPAPEGQYEHAMRVELYVYKNGELVYYDPDDPALYGFSKLLAELISGDVVGNLPNIEASPRNDIIGTGYPGYVFVAFDNTPYNYGMYQMPTDYAEGRIASVAFLNETKAVQFSASITINEAKNITGVGIYTEYIAGGGVTRHTLLFYDPLETPIQVNAGDVIAVVYRIVVP